MRKIGRILYNTLIGFYEDGSSTRAAALTYFTLMSIVPVLAVALGLARGFGFAQILEDVVKDQLSEQPEVSKYIINFAYSLLETTSSGVIAGIGVILLLWSVYNILGNIEDALNTIWKIPNPRSWVRKITDYIAAIIICPLFFVVSSSITIYLKTHFTDVSRWAVFLEYGLIHLFPYLLTWMLFTFLYFFLPNRRIPFTYGMIGVLVAGTAYQLLQAFYISIQLKLSSYGAVYGSFAALPLFLIWIDLSWMIILAGAQLAYQSEISAWNYVPAESNDHRICTSRRVLALLVAYAVVQAFREGQIPYTIHQLSDKFGASKKELDEIVKILNKHKILSETIIDEDSDIHYQPARDVSTLTLKTIVDIFPPMENDEVYLYKNPPVFYFQEKLDQYEQKAIDLRENFLLSKTITI
jgi:membrane protein